jgi:probable phosphoglycerate mutase
LERALETAEEIARPLNLRVSVAGGLIEINVGDWQGESVKKLSRLKLWKTVQGSPSCFRFPGGESFTEAQHRICLEIEALAQQHEVSDLVVCVSHADPIKLAVAHYIGMPLDLFQRLSVGPASITALSICETGSRLLTMNYDISFTF